MTYNQNTLEIYKSLNNDDNKGWEFVNRKNIDELKMIASKLQDKALELKFNLFIRMINIQR
jgi:hypothetical protein